MLDARDALGESPVWCARNSVLYRVDILGKKLATLISETLDGGDHNTEWNTSTLPTGSYFYRLSTPVMTQTKQLIVAR